jgi:HK97 family phage major capsid protein/HK97 family phage prohead protease
MAHASARTIFRRVEPGRALITPRIDFAVTKAVDQSGDIGILEGVATTAATDRMGDVVEPLGAQFKLPLPLLWQHDSKAPIGKVVAAKVTPTGIEIRAEVYKTLAQSIGTQWELIMNGLVPALSIGFRPIESEAIDPKQPYAGQRFTTWEWLELSAVTIPANADALITTTKSFCTPLDDQHRDGPGRAIASAAAAPRSSAPPGPPPRKPTPILGARPMKTAERIEQIEREICAHRDSIHETATICDTESRDPTEEEALAMKAAGEEIERKEITLGAYQAAMQTQAKAADRARNPSAPAILTARTRERSPGEFVFKTAVVRLNAFVNKTNPGEVAEALYANDSEAVTVIKSAVAPAQTTVPGWAEELTRYDIQGYMDILHPVSVWRQLAAEGQSLNFNGASLIKVPGRNITPQVAGSFVGEAGLIPVKKLGFVSASIYPYKMAVLSTFSNEIIQQSTPSVEAIVRQAMIDDTAQAIDLALLSLNAAVVGVRPPGIQVGMTTSASAGITLANVIADARLMITHVTTALCRKPVWIMHPARIQGLALLTNATGQFMFREELATGKWFGYPILSSTNVPPTVVFLVDAADFISAFDAPQFETSNQATIIEADDDGTPPYVGPPAGIEDIGSAAASTPPATVRSLFQTDSVALRQIMPLSWNQFRVANSYALTGVNW